MNNENDIIKKIAKYSATLAIVENSIGAILHSLHIPLAGHILSINQIAMLSRATFNLQNKKASLLISLSTSILKTLGPTGKKLTPMLAISAQGFFYYLPMHFLGINYFSLILSIILSATWAFFQNILGLIIFFGAPMYIVLKELSKDLKIFFPHAEQIIITALIGVIIIKIIITIVVSFWYIKISNADFEKLEARLTKKKPISKNKSQHQSLIISTLLELMNPLFISSLLLIAIYFYFNDSHLNHLIYYIMRPIAIGFVFLYLFKIIPTETIITFLQRMGLNELSIVLTETLASIQKSNLKLSNSVETFIADDEVENLQVEPK